MVKRVNQFFSDYANTPIDDRLEIVNFNKTGKMSRDDYYFRIKELNDKMRPMRIEQRKLIELYYNH